MPYIDISPKMINFTYKYKFKLIKKTVTKTHNGIYTN